MHIIPLDVSSVDAIEASAKLKVVRDVLGVHGLDYLINSAGVVRIIPLFCIRSFARSTLPSSLRTSCAKLCAL